MIPWAVRASGPRARRGRISGFVWGFLDQMLSSATSLVLSVVAGRELGPRGLGLVFLGFSAFLVALGSLRTLISDPLVTKTASAEADDRQAATNGALTLALGGSLGLTVLLAGLAAVVGGELGHSLLLFAPWLAPALLQDFWRSVLFRDRRASAAALNDGIWLATMVAAIPLPLIANSDWGIVAWWGGGAVAATVAGFVQTRTRPAALSDARALWSSSLWPFGRWLTAGNAVYHAGSYARVLAWAAILGAGPLGVIRAALALFAPLSLLAPAMSLPGLPAMTRALHASPRRAFRLALTLGGVTAALTAGYIMVLLLGGSRLLTTIFGRGFADAAGLLVPLGVGQMGKGAGIGFSLLLRAGRSGGALLLGSGVTSLSSLGLSVVLGLLYGVEGAAWGFAAGSVLGSMVLIAPALRIRRPRGGASLQPERSSARPLTDEA